MKKFLGLAVALSAFLFASCEDEPYTQQYEDFRKSEAYTYMPMKTGSYWVYEVEYINEDGTPYQGTDPLYTNSTDSVYIKDNRYYSGREAFIAENHNLTTGKMDSVVYAFVGNALYVYIKPLQGEPNMPQYGPKGWTEVFDLDYDSKVVFSEKLSTRNDSKTEQPYVDLDYAYSYEIGPNTQEEIIDGMGTWDIMNISYTNDLEITRSIWGMPPQSETKSSTDLRKLAKNVGPVYSETSTSTSGFLSAEERDTPIRVQKLLRYRL